MSEVRMLSLFRCSSMEGTREDVRKDARYFVTDYFDSIRVEKLDLNSTMLAECLGIKRQANEKMGVSHQRYCLWSEEDSGENDFFDDPDEYPVLTVIQLFVNPNVYQAETFGDGDGFTGENWLKRLNQFIEKRVNSDRKVKWKVYQLLTAGDFAVIVRSKKVHDAYDICTLIRGIRLSAKGTDLEAAFYSYSICGILDNNLWGDAPENLPRHWNKYLEPEDQVVIRIKYAQLFRGKLPENSVLKKELLAEGVHLLGRYDHQIIFSSEEFQLLYPYLRQYKFEDGIVREDNTGDIGSSKVRMLIEMMQKRYISYMNERLLLKYAEDPFLENAQIESWELECRGEWKSLYKINRQRIERIKKKISRLEEKAQRYYQSARNLKEYIRLEGRLCRVLYEINKLQELRISTARLLRQYENMVNSLESYLEKISEYRGNDYADVIEENLRHGIGALEIFTRYIRNVNLQTVQTPNYDLQTNMCAEKILLAYSQFLEPYMVKKTSPYYLSETLFPIIVPNMSVRDLSVVVLFDDGYSTDEEEETQKLMVVYSPTFSFLYETCFQIPAVFHEIAHQFKYEEREKRNDCLKRYVLKYFLYSVIIDLLNEGEQHDFKNSAVVKELIDVVYDRVLTHLLGAGDEKLRLQVFEGVLAEELDAFCKCAKWQEKLPAVQVKKYLEKTKGNIQEYDDHILESLHEIEACLHKMEEKESRIAEKAELSACDDRIDLQRQLKGLMKGLKNLQERQIRDCLTKELKAAAEDMSASKSDEAAEIEALCKEYEKLWSSSAMGSDEAGKHAFELWNTYEKEHAADTKDVMWNRHRKQIVHLLKGYHNVNAAYFGFDSAVENIPEAVSVKEKYQFMHRIKRLRLFDNMCEVLCQEMEARLKSYALERRDVLDWNTVSVPIERLNYITKEIRLRGKSGMCQAVQRAFSCHQEFETKAFVWQKIELYREMTSDLFMCAMMNLDIFGYLVVVTEILKFGENNWWPQEQRVSLVLQCLNEKDSLGSHDDKREFGNVLEKRVMEETKKLYEGLLKVVRADREKEQQLGKWLGQYKKDSMKDLCRFLKACPQENGLTSTQNWIIRVYTQIAFISWNVSRYIEYREDIVSKEIWEDITLDEAYYSKKEMLQEMLKENGGQKLCGEITKILNSPAQFFVKKNSILSEEIKFILSQYEKSCKNVFWE